MPRYTINRRYSAMYNATRLDYTVGAEVDLPEAQADWVNRDCPGTLSLVEPEPVADDAETDETGGGEEAESEEVDGEREAAAEAGKPARNRKHTPARTRS